MRAVLVFISSWLIGVHGWAARLLSVSSSSEQEVFRLEMQFDETIDPAKVPIQFDEKTIRLTLAEVETKKTLSPVEIKSNFISEVNLQVEKDKAIFVDIELTDLPAAQMKENLSIEGLGKALVIEILPPIWNKSPVDALSSVSTPVQEATSLKPEARPVAQDEKDIPLFEKKETQSSGTSGMGKLGAFVLVVLALGGYLIWWLKRRSKMVNGSESLMKIKVITQLHLGPKKTLLVVRVAGESLLLGTTDSHINLIKTLSLLDEDLPEVATNSFEKVMDAQEQAPRPASGEMMGEQGSDEEFSFGPAVKTTLREKVPALRRLI